MPGNRDRGACIASVGSIRGKERLRSSMREEGIQEISLKSVLCRTSLDIVSNIFDFFLRVMGLAGKI